MRQPTTGSRYWRICHALCSILRGSNSTMSKRKTFFWCIRLVLRRFRGRFLMLQRTWGKSLDRLGDSQRRLRKAKLPKSQSRNLLKNWECPWYHYPISIPIQAGDFKLWSILITETSHCHIFHMLLEVLDWQRCCSLRISVISTVYNMRRLRHVIAHSVRTNQRSALKFWEQIHLYT